VIAAKAAGASTIICTGLTRDAHRLEAGQALGADHIVMVDQEPLTDAVERITKGAGVDLVIDVSSGGASEVIGGALKALKKRGKLLTAAYKKKPLNDFDMDIIITKQATFRGVRGHSYKSVDCAVVDFSADQLRAWSTLSGRSDASTSRWSIVLRAMRSSASFHRLVAVSAHAAKRGFAS